MPITVPSYRTSRPGLGSEACEDLNRLFKLSDF
jgi:hypothetical protein